MGARGTRTLFVVCLRKNLGSENAFMGCSQELEIVKVLLSVAVEKDQMLVLLDVKCAFLFGDMQRSVYIEISRQYSRLGDDRAMGKLKMAMYDTTDAPHILVDTAREKMLGLGFSASGLRPSVFWLVRRQLTVVTHVVDVLCIGLPMDLQWMFDAVKNNYGLTKHIMGPECGEDVRYFKRVLRCGAHGIEWECDPTHVQIGVRGHGLDGV